MPRAQIYRMLQAHATHVLQRAHPDKTHMLPAQTGLKHFLTDGGEVKGAFTGVWGWCGGREEVAADGVVLAAANLSRAPIFM